MNTRELPVIELSGSPRARGRTYGEAVKEKIAEVVDCWLSELGSYGQQEKAHRQWNTAAYLEAFYRETRYPDAIQRWSPDLLEEIKGIAEASGQRFEHILGINLMDEEWVFGARYGLERPKDKCTAFAIANQKGIEPGYAGQNMDIGSWADGRQVLLRIMPDNNMPEALVFSLAGCIGLNGVNAAAIGVTCNTLSQLQHAVDGLPVLFIVRLLLGSNTLAQACESIKTVKHASGQNFILSSDHAIHCFECCGTSVVPYMPDDYRGRLVHTNHPLVNADITTVKDLNGCTDSTLRRLASINNRLVAPSREINLNDIKSALSAHDDTANPVSRNSNTSASSIGFTAGSSIYEFGQNPQLHLAAGPPCETEFLTYQFLTNV